MLARLDVPYLAVTPVEFQTLEQWGGSERGLLPVEATMMVAIPELDGATGPMVFGGRGSASARRLHRLRARAARSSSVGDAHDMHSCIERADALAARVGKLVELRRSERAERKVAVVLFNFPPNAGNTGTAAFLSVFESLYNTLAAMQREGYTVEVPASVDELRERIIARQCRRASARRPTCMRASPPTTTCAARRWLREIEAQWGPAPGRQQSDGSSIFVLGERFGNVFVGIQPAFGYEGDPMRLLFEKGFAPTHAFSAFYRWLREDFGAACGAAFRHPRRARVHARQADRPVGRLLARPADRRPAEPLSLRREQSVRRHDRQAPRGRDADQLPDAAGRAGRAVPRPGRSQGARSSAGAAWSPRRAHERDELARADPGAGRRARPRRRPSRPGATTRDARDRRGSSDAVLELEYTLIPHGLHVVGEAPTPSRARRPAAGAGRGRARRAARARRGRGAGGRRAPKPRSRWRTPADARRWRCCASSPPPTALLAEDHEIAGILRALDGRFLRPAPGGDLLRTPAILPTGRNLHGFDPFRIPSAFAVQDGARQAERLLQRHMADGHAFPESIALVLWGTDNLKSEGGPIAQALALIGAEPRFDSYGRLAGAELIPLARARPAARRRGHHAVGHLPRPAAAADQAARRGRVPGRRAPTSRSSRTSSASTRWPTRPSTAATWRPRRCACSAMPTAPTAPTSTT